MYHSRNKNYIALFAALPPYYAHMQNDANETCFKSLSHLNIICDNNADSIFSNAIYMLFYILHMMRINIHIRCVHRIRDCQF